MYCVNPSGRYLGMSPRSRGLVQGLGRSTETRRCAARAKYHNMCTYLKDSEPAEGALVFTDMSPNNKEDDVQVQPVLPYSAPCAFMLIRCQLNVLLCCRKVPPASECYSSTCVDKRKLGRLTCCIYRSVIGRETLHVVARLTAYELQEFSKVMETRPTPLPLGNDFSR